MHSNPKHIPRILTGLCVLMCSLLVPLVAYAAGHEDDETPPVLFRIAVSRSSAYPGETVTVSADADDDDSGVQSIAVRFQNTEGENVLSATLLLNSDGEIDLPYSGLLKLPQDMASGSYEVVSATLTDWEENRVVYTKGGSHPLDSNMLASFSVAPAAGQPTPASCQAQATADGVEIRFAAASQGAGIDQVTLLFENSINHHKLTFTMEEEHGEDGIYTGQFDIPEHEPSGTFSLKKVTIKDIAGHKTTWTTRDDDDKLPLTISASFVHQSPHSDTQAPVLHSVTTGQPVWDGDEARVLLTVRAEDDYSGIEHITVKFVHTVTGDKVSKVLRAADSGDGSTFAGELKLDEDDPPGTYRLDQVTLADRSGNRSTYCHPDDVNDRKLPLPQVITFQLQS